MKLNSGIAVANPEVRFAGLFRSDLGALDNPEPDNVRLMSSRT